MGHNPCTITHHAPPRDPQQNVTIHEGGPDATRQIGGTHTRVVITAPDPIAPRIVSSTVQLDPPGDVDTSNAVRGAALPPGNVVHHTGIPTTVEILGPVDVKALLAGTVGKAGEVIHTDGLVPTTVEHTGPASPSPIAIPAREERTERTTERTEKGKRR